MFSLFSLCIYAFAAVFLCATVFFDEYRLIYNKRLIYNNGITQLSAVAAARRAAARLLLSAMQQSIDILAAGRTACSSKPAAAESGGQLGHTDGGTPYRYMDLAAHYYAGSANKRDLCMAPYTACKKVKAAHARLPSVGFRS